jgi:hypothetical protein
MVVKKNKFKEYENKSSVKKRYSRYSQGGNTEIFSNKLGWWERFKLTYSNNGDIEIKHLPKIYDRRPDLLAYDIYQKSEFDWIILQYNNIVDVQEEFVTGVRLVLPSKLKANIDIMNNSSRNINVDP